MGYGLPGAVGLALAKKLKGEGGKVYCLMSDGELAIGTTWESYLIAKKQRLDNLIIVVDKNRLQAMGETNDILPSYFPETLSFEVNGHDFGELRGVFKKV